MTSMVSSIFGHSSIFSSNENNSRGISNADIDDHHSLHLFCQLQKVSFRNLKEIKTDRNPFSCGHKIHVSLFSGLEELSIYEYNSSMSLFSSSIARDLLNLRELIICRCDELVQVIKDEEEKAVCGGQMTRLFPKLQELQLDDLPKLVSFCEWKCYVEVTSLRRVVINKFPNMKIFTLGFLAAPNLEAFETGLDNYIELVPFDNLKKLRISSYKGSMSLFSSSTAGKLVNLIKLSIIECDEMVKVIEDKEEKEEDKLLSDAAQRTTLLFPKLQGLELNYLPKLVSFCEWKCDVELPSLRKVVIYKCHNMKIFTLGFLAAPNLEDLSIGHCDEMVKVIEEEEEKNEEKLVSGGQRTLLFPKLQQLQLYNLPKLVSFCEWKCDVELPSLRELRIHDCPNMKNLSLGSLAAPILEDFTTALNHFLEVPFDNLKELTIYIHKGSMSLFSSSTAGKLVSLKELSISYCNEMVKVIEDKEEKEEDKLVIAAAQRTTLLFPKLQELRLIDLPKLKSFCEWKCDVELPSLRELRIHNCPNMKYFTLGLITTPKLEIVKINGEDFGGVKDLNEN